MRRRSEIWIALASGTVIALAVTLAGGRQTGIDLDFRRSTLLSGAENSSGLAELFEGLGLEIEQRREPMFRLSDPDSTRLIAIMTPVITLHKFEMQRLAEYLENGGQVFVAGSRDIISCFGFVTSLSKEKGSSVRYGDTRAQPPAAQRLYFHTPPENSEKVDRSDESDWCPRVDIARVDTVMTAAPNRVPIGLDIHVGAGTLHALASSNWVANKTLKTTGISAALLPWLLEGPWNTVVFDEYHLGFQNRASLWGAFWDWLVREQVGHALLHLAIAGALLLLISAIRFGPPTLAINRQRRSELEHVEAVAAALETAGAAKTTSTLLISGLRRRLTHRTDRKHNHDWLATIRDDGGPVDRLLEGLREAEKLPAEERTLKTARTMEAIWTTLKSPKKQPGF